MAAPPCRLLAPTLPPELHHAGLQERIHRTIGVPEKFGEGLYGARRGWSWARVAKQLQVMRELRSGLGAGTSPGFTVLPSSRRSAQLSERPEV